MKKFIIGVLMLSIGLSGYFSDNFLKYSTFYTSVSLESPFTPKQKFAVNTDEGTFEETTAIVPAYKDQDHHPMRAMHMNDWGCLQSTVASKDISSNRQELPDNYFMCHNFWVVKWPVREQGTGPWYFLGANVRPYFIDDYSTQDIHEKEDLIRATEWVRTNA